MSERTPSAHSMTVETPDPETERENLAQKVFLLERWKAEAVVTIGKLLGERDEARTERDELKTSLEAAEASIEVLRDSFNERGAELEKVQAELADARSRRRMFLDALNGALDMKQTESPPEWLEATAVIGSVRALRQMLDDVRRHSDARVKDVERERDDFQRRLDQCRDMFRASLDAI